MVEKTLEGAIAVVTGAGRGIGAATAVELGMRGARVCVTARTASELTRICVRLAEDGTQALPVVCDVTDEEQVKRLFREVRERLGKVTHLVNNAGTAQPAKVGEMTLAQFRENLDANLVGTFLCTREALPDMLPSGKGRIVNVASVSGVPNVSKFPGFSAYAAAKAGVIAFTEALAAEVGGQGIRVLAVSPGSVGTRLFERVAPAGSKADLHPHDVGKIIAFMCSEGAGVANGSNLILWGR